MKCFNCSLTISLPLSILLMIRTKGFKCENTCLQINVKRHEKKGEFKEYNMELEYTIYKFKSTCKP